MARVLVSVPNTGWIHSGTMTSVVRILGDRRHHVQMITPQACPYENNMNRIAAFVRKEAFDFWLNIDSDNEPVRDPLELVDLDLDVVGMPYPIVKIGERHPLGWSVFHRASDGWRPQAYVNGDKLTRVDAVGSGCMLVAKRVVESVRAPFLREYSRDGIVTEGADLAFCRRARESGFAVWAHYDYPARHHKSVDLYEIQRARASELDG